MEGFGLTTYPIGLKDGHERQCVRIYIDGVLKSNIILTRKDDDEDDIDVKVYRPQKEQPRVENNEQ